MIESGMPSSFDSTKKELKKLLEDVCEGTIQLPDFQRGWVWDDSHIRSLLVSIARSFPIGSVMLLETGGTTRFQIRPVEGVLTTTTAEKLILDGQQRLTSLTQVLMLKSPVQTRDDKGREVLRHYYFDIEKALSGPENLDDSIVAVDASRLQKTNFGRDIVLDLSTPELEYRSFHFPADQILNSDAWENGLVLFNKDQLIRFFEFRAKVLAPFREYLVPIIELKKETSKEAVCLVFEKVNTGGVALSVFELSTATFAADGFNLRADWYGDPRAGIKGRTHRFAEKPLLKAVEPTEFLQAVTLLHSYELRQTDLKSGKSPKESSAVSAKRESVLMLPLSAYQKWSEPLSNGFVAADSFLRSEGFHSPRYLPYRSQLIPLAAIMALLGDKWMQPLIKAKLARWFWCGVLGEMYGGAVETRIGLDLTQVLDWVSSDEAAEPVTVAGSAFSPGRLDTLRTRTSAAYRGLYVLLQREGAEDFYWARRMVDLDRDECKIDIHHIFPKKWCEGQGIPPKTYNSIINKTAISYLANRSIGGKAPSLYLVQLANATGNPPAKLDGLLGSHLIEPALLRADEFQAFYDARKAALLGLITEVMGKAVLQGSAEAPAEDDVEDEEEAVAEAA